MLSLLSSAGLKGVKLLLLDIALYEIQILGKLGNQIPNPFVKGCQWAGFERREDPCLRAHLLRDGLAFPESPEEGIWRQLKAQPPFPGQQSPTHCPHHGLLTSSAPLGTQPACHLTTTGDVGVSRGHCSHSAQSLSPVRLFVTPRTAAHQASLSFTIFFLKSQK